MVEVIDSDDGSSVHSEEQKKIANNSEHILYRVIYDEDSIWEDYSPKER